MKGRGSDRWWERRWWLCWGDAQDEVNQEESEHNEVDGMKKGVGTERFMASCYTYLSVCLSVCHSSVWRQTADLVVTEVKDYWRSPSIKSVHALKGADISIRKLENGYDGRTINRKSRVVHRYRHYQAVTLNDRQGSSSYCYMKTVQGTISWTRATK